MHKISVLTLLLALMACQSPIDTGVVAIQPALATEPPMRLFAGLLATYPNRAIPMCSAPHSMQQCP